MVKYFILFFLFICSVSCYSQIYRAIASENYELEIESVRSYSKLTSIRNNPQRITQKEGFPKVFEASTNFKNFRNVTLADLDGDGIAEILTGIKDIFTVWKKDALLWAFEGNGTFIYPPTVGDLDGDGDLEIIQVTGGIPSSGLVYAWDHLGNELPGWPRNFDQNWILTTAAISDVDDDSDLEVILIERNPPGGRVHIVHHDGSNFGFGWPVTLPGTPATTPSVADLDGDDLKDIVIATTTELYVLNINGITKSGWPLSNPDTRFSFQSPLLADVNQNGHLEIIGATHGDIPEYYVLNNQGDPLDGWPIPVESGQWTYSTPSIMKHDESWNIFMGRPSLVDGPINAVFGWDPSGDLLPHFPIQKEGGNEGVLAIADVNGDQQYELVFSSNHFDAETGTGFIHAYDINTGLEIEGFPLRPKGWTYMNGANIGDIDGDGQLELVALSYTQYFGERPDTTFLNVFDLEGPATPEAVVWGTYKGSNNRTGYVESAQTTPVLVNEHQQSSSDFLYPNPTAGLVYSTKSAGQLSIYTIGGQCMFTSELRPGLEIKLKSGIYLGVIQEGQRRWVQKLIVH